ncbi:DUF7681 family protein [Tateyamaria sp.]|uniref:Acb2/Tad1 domain-containing protein n=1 Tax=Tateyamaria sp. TaxID=1929288 RepID=UPI003B212694
MTATLALMNIGNHPDDEVTFVSGSDEFTLRRGEHTAYGVRVDDGFSFNVRQVRHADGSECRETIPMLLTKEGPGGDLVRADFNPSENDRVARLKQIAGALINECDVVREENPNAARHVSLAITAVEEAAMWAVKAATTELKGTDKRQVTNTKKTR